MTVKVIYYFFSYFAVSLGLALALVPLMRPLSFRLGAVDKGTGRRAHKGVLPRLGGIGIFLAFLFPVAFWLTRGRWDSFHGNMVGILIGCALIFFIGVYDDIRGARVRTKLFVEVIAAVFINVWGGRISDIHLQLVYTILAGSLLGFLRYNFPPASIFMGDSGSLFIGFFLASISVFSSHKAATMATMMVPLIAFSLPLMDMLYAVLRRYYRGVDLGKADKEHIHHKLLEKGFTKKKALLILYSLNVCIMLLVLLLVRKHTNIDFLGLIVLAFIAVAGLRLLGYLEFLPFIREVFRKHGIGKKRRYYDYVVGRFRNDAARSESPEDLKAHLTRLLSEYNFSSVEVILHAPHIDNPFYEYKNGNAPARTVSLSFPVTGPGSDCLGEVRMSKAMDDDYIVVTPDLIQAISEKIGSAVKGMAETDTRSVGDNGFRTK
ncbi:MAG: MraY family glycosyltransferase [Candidatus Sulfobium sp.]